jgi:ATP-dependent DNA helicase RecQ
LSAKQILQQYWGHHQFRPLQEEIVEAVLRGEDVLALLPTGGGKSVCFQVPAMMKEGICLVISPLIALMKDQVENLKKKGIKAIAIYSGMRADETDVAFDNCIHGNIKFLYLSPERLITELARERIARMKVNLIAVDEAHCISQWGYDFRPPYLKIAEIRDLHPSIPVIALTATATAEVKDDIMQKLNFRKPCVYQKSFERKNLSYVVFYEEDKFTRMLNVIRKVPGSGIVYVRSRKKTKEIAEFLDYHQVPSHFYHAGLEQAVRSRRQDEWVHGKVQAIVATNAFGMGIDKPDVRWVIHMDVPDTPEAYYQEAGRAGRDEKQAYAVLLYQPLDLENLQKQVMQSFPPLEEIKTVYQAVANFLQVAVGSGQGVSYDFNLFSFCESYKLDTVKTYSCLKLLELEGYLVTSDSVAQQSKIHITVNGNDLYNFQVQQAGYDHFIKVLLRSYEGLYDDFVGINEGDIAKRTGMTADNVLRSLKYLEKLSILRYVPKKESPQLVFLLPRVPAEDVRISRENLQERKKRAEIKMNAMIGYITEKDRCRSQMLLGYFGEKSSHRCGVCDYCRNRNKLDLNEIEFKGIRDKIKKAVIKKHLPLDKLVDELHIPNDDKALKIIQWLLDNEHLRYTRENELEWVE